MVRVLFSSTLREHTKWYLFQQSFSLSRGIEITETINVDFDLCLEDNVSNRKVMARLLDPSTVIHTHMQGSTLNNWASKVTPEIHVVLLLPADNSVDQASALQILQLHLLSLQATASVLSIPYIDQVLSTLTTYASCNMAIEPSSGREVSPVQVIPYATSSAPKVLLSDDEAYTTRQVCGSIVGLELYTRSREGQNRLSQFLDPILVQSMVDFWKDEWIV